MISERNRQIAILAATTPLQNKEIADRVGCHYNTVTRVLKRPEVQEFIREIQESIHKRQEKVIEDLSAAFNLAAPSAFNKLIDLMNNSSSPAVQLRACESVLDRSEAPHKVLHEKREPERKITLRLSKAELDMQKATLIEAGISMEEFGPFPEVGEDEEFVIVSDGKGNTLKEEIRKIGG